MKKISSLLLILTLVCLIFSAIACNPTNEKKPDDTDEKDKINATITAEPADYVKPTLDSITADPTTPTLTDTEMYEVVFNKQSPKYLAGEDIPEINYANGEALLTFTEYNAETKVHDVAYSYLCKGVSSASLAGQSNKYKIKRSLLTQQINSAKTVTSNYWQQYFDVMLANVTFTQANDEQTTKESQVAELYNGNTTYKIYSDGKILCENNDNVQFGDKKVDAALIYMLALMYDEASLTNGYLFDKHDVQVDFRLSLPEQIELHYNEKVAKFDQNELIKLCKTETSGEFSVKSTINQHFLNFSDYAYFYFAEENSSISYVITSDGTLYCNYQTRLVTQLENGQMIGVTSQRTLSYGNAINFTKIQSLLK